MDYKGKYLDLEIKHLEIALSKELDLIAKGDCPTCGQSTTKLSTKTDKSLLKNLKESLKTTKNFDELILKMKAKGFEIQLSTNVKDGVSGMRIVMLKDKKPNTEKQNILYLIKYLYTWLHHIEHIYHIGLSFHNKEYQKFVVWHRG